MIRGSFSDNVRQAHSGTAWYKAAGQQRRNR